MVQLPNLLRALFGVALMICNTVFWCLALYVFAFLKFCAARTRFADWCSRRMAQIGENWIACNSLGLDLLYNIDWQVFYPSELLTDRSYLVCSNHQSWIDIVVLQKVLNRRVPFLRFFLKHELIYIPFLGAAWWALDFPFMKRHSKAELDRHPEKRGEDLRATKQACERFRGAPISILNFLEGTRITAAKHAKSQSQYRYLLPPKTGGIAFVLNAMGTQFDSLLDVTVFYPKGRQSLWGLFMGRVQTVVVYVDRVVIPAELTNGDYFADAVFREKLQSWVRDLWSAKDAKLASLYSKATATTGR